MFMLMLIFMFMFMLSFLCVMRCVCFCTRGRVDTSGHFFIVSNHKVFYDVAFRSSLGRFLACQKSLFCEKRICVFIINGPNRWDFV